MKLLALVTKRPTLVLLLAVHILAVSALLQAPIPDHQVSSAPHKVVAAPKPVSTPVVKTIQGVPVRIRVPNLNIDLPVRVGEYDVARNTWTLGDGAAYYANLSATINNQQGNTLIYGHNNWGVFAALTEVPEGTVIEIQTSNGHYFYYTYMSSVTVSPDDTSLFGYQGSPILTLQTCSGNRYQNRTLTQYRLTRIVPAVDPVAVAHAQSMQRIRSVIAAQLPLSHHQFTVPGLQPHN